MSTLMNVTDKSFEQDVLKASKPFLLDFWAEWCGPCRMIGPILEEVAAHFGDKVIIGKMNVDNNTTMPTKYDVRSIPTLILFKNGALVEKNVGGMTKQQLIEFLSNHL